MTITKAMAVEVVKRLARKQIWMRRRVTGGRRRRRRGRTGGGGMLLFIMSLVVPGGKAWRLLGLKQKLGIGEKKAQKGIKTKNMSTTTSAGSKKKRTILVLCLIEILFTNFKKRGKTHSPVE